MAGWAGNFCLGVRWGSPLASARREPDLSMAKKEFTILNKLGIHARPAAQFVKTANRFKADVFVEKDGEEVDGKSIMGLMMLAAGHGSVILVSAPARTARIPSPAAAVRTRRSISTTGFPDRSCRGWSSTDCDRG